MLTILATFLALQAAPAPPAAPAPLPPAVPANWREQPVNAGFWRWRAVPGGSEALFLDSGGVQLTLRCTLATRRVLLVRAGAMPSLRLRLGTTSSERVLPPGNAVLASDPLLDALAFSRGRIAVTATGALPLIVPAWPEAARAIEDCRS
jgi:hypothetical protein